jgi:hypothetical protein
MRTTKKYESIYEGIVIQNDDPAGMGRVKVFVPVIHSSLILQKQDYEDENVMLGGFGENLNEGAQSLDVTQYIDELRSKINTWARVVMPITGETGATKYNSTNKLVTDSDSDDFDAAFNQNRTQVPDGPGASLAGMEDVWGSTSNSGGIAVNPNSGGYNFNKRYNQAKGSFGTIAVNTLVWVKFINGNPMSPLVEGAAVPAVAAQEMYTPDIAPGDYENRESAGGTGSVESQIYRGGSVQNDGAMTKVSKSTTGEAMYSETFKTGSGRTYLTDGTVADLQTSNKQTATLGDEFSQTNGTRNVYVGGTQTSVTKNDSILRVGSLNVAAAQAQKAILEGIHEKKNLFEIQRAEGGSIYSSSQQKKSGTPKPCPECSQGKTYPAINSNIEEQLNKIPEIAISFFEGLINDIINKVLGTISKFLGFSSAPRIKITLPKIKIKFPGLQLIPFPPTAKCKTCRGVGESPFSYDGTWDPEPEKENIKQEYEQASPQLTATEQAMGDGGNYLVEVTRNMVVNVGCAMNMMSDVKFDKKGKKAPVGLTVGEERTYAKHGETPVLEKTHVDNLAGGSLSFIAGNCCNFIVGSRGLNFDCFGSVRLNGSIVQIGGSQVIVSSQNEVKISSGSRLSLEGKALSLKGGGGQVLMENNLGVAGNMMVAGGAHIEGELCVNHITAPLELQRTDYVPMLKGQTNPIEPKIIGYIQEEVEMECDITVDLGGILNIAGPVTGTSRGRIKLLADIPIRSIGKDGAEPDPESLHVYPHYHLFRNIPITLTGSNKEVREIGKQMEGKDPVPPKEPKFEVKGTEAQKNQHFVEPSMLEENFSGEEDRLYKPVSFDEDSPTGDWYQEPDNTTSFAQSDNSDWSVT